MGPSSLSAGERCIGTPDVRGGWAKLGKPLTAAECQVACLDDEDCKWAVFNSRNGACSGFSRSKCSETRQTTMKIWEKVSSSTSIMTTAATASTIATTTTTSTTTTT